MTLTEWPAKLKRRLTPAQVRMIRDGWDKAKAAGWLQRDWWVVGQSNRLSGAAGSFER